MLPSDTFAEIELLGSILHDPGQMVDVTGEHLVDPSEIFTPEHALIFDAILQMDAAGENINPMAIASRLNRDNNLERAGGLEYIQSLTEHAGSVREASDRIVHTAMRRKVMEYTAFATTRAQNEGIPVEQVIDDMIEKLFTLRRRRGKEVISMRDLMEVFTSRVERQMAGDRSMVLRTRIRALDDIINEIEANDYVLIGGRPGDGKSTLQKYIAWKTAIGAGNERKGVYIADYEEGEALWAMNMVGIQSGIDTTLLRHPERMTETQREAMYTAIQTLGNAPIYPDSMGATTVVNYKSRLMRAMQRCEREYNVPIGFHGSDYIQLMTGSGLERADSEVGRHTQVSNAMRRLSQPDQIGLPGIHTAQLNRTPTGSNGRPREYEISDLRETGALEQDATIVMFPIRLWVLNPPSVDDIRRFGENVAPDGSLWPKWRVEPVQIKVGKNRHGGTGKTVTLLWEKYRGRYVEDERLS